MPSPNSIKEVQTLISRLVALNRFLSNYAFKSFPFVHTLRNVRKKTQFRWTPEADVAFCKMKQCLTYLPTLTTPLPEEPLTLYLSASDTTIGAVVLVERNKVQTPIYYISRTLADAETRYTATEKLILALVHASRRLRQYFQGHPIHVLTDYRINTLLSKPELFGRLAKWAIELGFHTIIYKPRPAIKGQVLADFVAEIPLEKLEECQNE